MGSVLVASLEEMLPIKLERLVEIAKAFGVLSTGQSPRRVAQEGIERIRIASGKDIRFPSLSEATGGKEAIDIDLLMTDVAQKKPQIVRTPADQEHLRNVVRRSLEF